MLRDLVNQLLEKQLLDSFSPRSSVKTFLQFAVVTRLFQILEAKTITSSRIKIGNRDIFLPFVIGDEFIQSLSLAIEMVYCLTK